MSDNLCNNSNETLLEDDKDYIRTYVEGGITDTEKKMRRRECADLYGVSLARIGAITAWTTIRAKRVLQSAGLEQTTSHAEALSPVTEEVEEAQCETQVGDQTEERPAALQDRRGDAIDYDNELKERWRLKWKEYLETHTTPEERATMRVLCLPGRQCLEIPLYLALGFKPENIVGVEGGSEEARLEFVEKATRFGIQHRIGRLEKLLPNEDPFDVISLDFHGNVSMTMLRILEQLPVSEKAHVMVNILGAREGELGRLWLDLTSRTFDQKNTQSTPQFPMGRMTKRTRLGVFLQKTRQLPAAQKKQLALQMNGPSIDHNAPAGELQDVRNETLFPMVVNTIGSKRLIEPRVQILHTKLLNMLSATSNPELKREVDKMLIIASQMTADLFEEWSTRHEYIGKEMPKSVYIHALLLQATHDRLLLTDSKKMTYNSTSSKARPPYYTLCLSLERKLGPLMSSPTVEFLFQCVEFFTKALLEMQEFIARKQLDEKVANLSFEELFPSFGLSRKPGLGRACSDALKKAGVIRDSARLAFPKDMLNLRWRNQIVSQLPLSTLQSDLTQARKIIRDDMPFLHQKNNKDPNAPWEMIV